MQTNILIERIIETIIPEQEESNLFHVFLRVSFLFILLLYSFSMFGGISIDTAAKFLHLVNLPFHEAGHIFFGFFGQFIGSLGGMLGQLLMPLICAFVFLFQQRDAFGASFAMWWFAQNFVDLAPYIQDASVGELPLIGGNTGQSSPYGFHDFEYLLNETGLIAYDQELAIFSYILGCLLMILFITWGAIITYKQWQNCLYNQ